MKLRIRSQADFLAGLLFVAFGVAAMLLAANYPAGEVRRMGPGYFPMLLGALLTALGALISLRALWLRGVPIGRLALRPMLLVSGAILGFALGITYLGLIPAAVAVVVIASLANTPVRRREVAIAAIALAAFSAALFVWGLGLTINLFG